MGRQRFARFLSVAVVLLAIAGSGFLTAGADGVTSALATGLAQTVGLDTGSSQPSTAGERAVPKWKAMPPPPQRNEGRPAGTTIERLKGVAGSDSGVYVYLGAAAQRRFSSRVRLRKSVTAALAHERAQAQRRDTTQAFRGTSTAAGAYGGAARPTELVAPRLAGHASFRRMVTADIGGWASTAPIAFGFQWQVCPAAPTAGSCTDLLGATSASYSPDWFDFADGQLLRVEISAWSFNGETTVYSPETAISGTAPTLTTAPKLAIDQSTGVVSVTTGSWANAQSEPLDFKYRWQLCNASGADCGDAARDHLFGRLGSEILPRPSAVSGSTYLPLASAAGMSVRVIVTATDPFGSAATTVGPIRVGKTAPATPGAAATIPIGKRPPRQPVPATSPVSKTGSSTISNAQAAGAFFGSGSKVRTLASASVVTDGCDAGPATPDPSSNSPTNGENFVVQPGADASINLWATWADTCESGIFQFLVGPAGPGGLGTNWQYEWEYNEQITSDDDWCINAGMPWYCTLSYGDEDYSNWSLPWGQYWWQVGATDTGGNGTAPNLDGGGFQVVELPNVATLASPASDATVETVSPTLVASSPTNDEGDSVDYYFEVSTSPSFSSILWDSGWTSSSSVTLPTTSPVLDNGGAYYWRVDTEDYWGVQPSWSASGEFTVETDTLGLGSDGQNSEGPIWNSGPIDVNEATGNLMLTAPSPSFPTAAGNLAVSVVFNSGAVSSVNDGLGGGWQIGPAGNVPFELVNLAITQDTAGEIERAWTNGTTEIYTQVSGSPVYLGEKGSQLTNNGNGSWTLVDTDGSVYTFIEPSGYETSGSPNYGILQLETAQTVSSDSPLTGRLVYSYTEASGINYLTKVQAMSGETPIANAALSLYWSALDPSDEPSVCGSPTLCVVGPDGTAWAYSTTSGGRLQTVNDGTRAMFSITYGSNDLPEYLYNADELATGYSGSAKVTLGYNSDSTPQLTSISNGPITDQTPSTAEWTFAYHTGGTTHATQAAHAGIAADQTRSAAGYTTITSPCGQSTGTCPDVSGTGTTTVYYDSNDFLMEKDGPLGTYTQTQYNSNGQLLWSEDQAGNPTDYTYDPTSDALTSVTGPPVTSSPTTAGYAAAVLADSPVAFWPLDETSGTTAVDRSGYGNNGSYSGTHTLGEDGEPAGTEAVAFNGGKVSATVPQINTTSGGYNTVEFWMDWNGESSSMPVAFGSYDLLLSDGYFGFNTGSGDLYGVPAPSEDAWHFVVAEFYNGVPSDGARLWIDGAPQTLTQEAGTSGTASASTSFQISGSPSGGYTMGGSIDDVAVYNSALSSGEITAQYDAATGVGARPVTSYYYDESAAGSINDGVYSPGPATQGLQADYYATPSLVPANGGTADAYSDEIGDCSSEPDTFCFDWGSGGPSALGSVGSGYSVRLTGDLTVPASNDYEFSVVSDGCQQFMIDNQTLWSNWGGSCTDPTETNENSTPDIYLTAGKHTFTFLYSEPEESDSNFSISWECTDGGSCGSGAPTSWTLIPMDDLTPAWNNVTTVLSPAGRFIYSHYAQPWLGVPDYTLQQSPSGAQAITSYTYDDFGRVTSKTLPLGNEGRTISDGTLEGSPDGYTTTYSYYPTAGPTLTTSGNEITDASREAGVDGDGLTPPGGYGIWEGTTNLVPNGGFTANTSGWTGVEGDETLSQSTSQYMFGSASLSVQTPGTDSGEGVQMSSVSINSSDYYAISFWIKTSVPLQWSYAGHGYRDISASSSWQRIIWSYGDTSSANLKIVTESAVATTFYLDGVQLEQIPVNTYAYPTYATPYVATSDGAASRGNAEIKAPASLLGTSGQFWWAGSVNIPVISNGWFQTVASWSNPSQTDEYQLGVNDEGIWELQVTGAGGTDSVTADYDGNPSGDYTVIADISPTQIGISIDGNTFETATNSQSPTGLDSSFQLGTTEGASWLEGDINWFAAGTGTLTNTDAASLADYGTTDPTLSQIPTDGEASLDWNAQSPIYDVPTNSLTTSGNEITDASREAGVDGDGLTPPGGYGIWEGTTNLVPNGGFTANTSGWTGVEGDETLSQSTSQYMFGSASLSVQTPGTHSGEGVQMSSVSINSSDYYTMSFWIKTSTPLKWSYAARGAYRDISPSSSWQHIAWSYGGVSSASPKIVTESAVGTTFYLDGVQLEQIPVNTYTYPWYATPYVATSDGAASRGNAEVKAPASLLGTSGQFWWAGSVNIPVISNGWFQTVASWSNPSQTDEYQLGVNDEGIWELQVTGAGGTDSVTADYDGNPSGDYTVIADISPTQIGISIDGNTFETATNSQSPTGLDSSFQLGTTEGASWLEGDINWFAAGTGVLTNADALAFANDGTTDPTIGQIPSDVDPTIDWNASTAAYATPGSGTTYIPGVCGGGEAPSQLGLLESVQPPGSTAATTYVYNSAGQPVATMNGAGTTCTSYTSEGRIASKTDGDGNVTNYTYDPNGNAATITDALGNAEQKTYDEANRLVSDTDRDANTTSYTYDGDGNVVTVTDATGGVTSYGYDAADEKTSMTDPRGYATTYAYDSLGQLISTTTSLGYTTTTSYSPQGWVLSTTSANAYAGEDCASSSDCGTTTYGYDADGNKLVSIDPFENMTVDQYNDLGQLASTTTPLGNTTSYGYDLDGNKVSVTDPDGGVAHMTYNQSGTLASTTSPLDPSITGSSLTAYETTYAYDDDNRLLSTTLPTGETTSQTWDPASNKTSTTDAAGNTTTYSYDADNQLIQVTTPNYEQSETAYDPDGNVIETTDAIGYSTTYSYDGDGNLTQKIVDPTSLDPGGLNNTWTYTYDADGDKLTATDPDGNETTYAYNQDDELTAITAPDGDSSHETNFGYDPDGNTITVTDPDGNETEYVYNADDELIQKTIAPATLDESWTYTYDPDGNQLTVTDPDGNTTTNSYDSDDRLTQISYSDGTPTVTYTYNYAGDRTEMTDGASEPEYYTYDNSNRLLTVSRGTGSDAPTFTYTYNSAGQLASREDPDGTTTSYTYNADDELATTTVGSNTTSYSYDEDGNLTETSLPNGWTEHRGYDAADRLVYMASDNWPTSPESWLDEVSYTLDGDGNPVEIDRYPPLTHEYYSYDSDGRVTAVCYGHAISGCPTADLITYAYDYAGNRTSETNDGTTTNYTYNAGNELTQATVVGGATTDYAYDADGNEISNGTDTISYNAASEVTSITDGSTTIASFTYDGDGNRLTKTTSAGTTNYLWDINASLPTLAEDLNGSTEIAGYQYGADTGNGLDPLSMTSGGDTYYFHIDPQGNTAAITDQSGNVDWTYTYDPYGNVRSATKVNSSAPVNDSMFQGQLLDPETGLYDLRARLYDPTTGRFLSSDPAGETPGASAQSLYAYASNNPLVFADLSGDSDYSDCIATYPDNTDICAGMAGDPNQADCDPACTGGNQSPDMYDTGETVYAPGAISTDEQATLDQAAGQEAAQEAQAEATQAEQVAQQTGTQQAAQQAAVAASAAQAAQEAVASGDDAAAAQDFGVALTAPASTTPLITSVTTPSTSDVVTSQVSAPASSITATGVLEDDVLNGNGGDFGGSEGGATDGGPGEGSGGGGGGGNLPETGVTITSGSPDNLVYGQQVHNYIQEIEYGYGDWQPEYRLPNGQRADLVSIEKTTVVEIKPDNLSGIQTGTEQLKSYVAQLEDEYGTPFTGILYLYPSKPLP